MSGNALSPRSATALAFGIILLVFLIFMFIYLLPIIRNPRCVQGSWRPTNDEEHKEPKKLPRLSLAIPKTSPFMLRSPLSLLSTSSPITPPPPVYAASSLSRTSPSPDYSSQPPSPRDMKSPRATPFSNGLGTSGWICRSTFLRSLFVPIQIPHTFLSLVLTMHPLYGLMLDDEHADTWFAGRLVALKL